ncbi:MAG: hypothetical protein ONB30_03885 [candidate division KSB1 bacterium]|nr:hypothetical protein [candidate division KSB1 bacterium]MDZ7337660.1 hypothetical protein [candidate division KSB1 bacterium]MDZ7378473.1 hypothetical protein [candidate division KSB1 bacterium]MDZ7385663.1 hypothetical protein [candidate division KSB1 bacterium]MDZ7394131.1 hypothetical protein [candidate division KSB1 bacterium]
MEVKLETLIEKIKKEGIEEARQTSEQIVAQAQAQAAATVAQAQEEAARIIAQGKAEAERFRRNAELALQQAARDTVLSLKERVSELFDRVFKQEVAQTLSPEFLSQLIQSLVNQWARDGSAEVVVSAEDKEKLQALLFAGVRQQLRDGLVLRVGDSVSKGFRIGLRGEDVYYDFTDESIAEVLKSFLNPTLQALLNGQNNG